MFGRSESSEEDSTYFHETKLISSHNINTEHKTFHLFICLTCLPDNNLGPDWTFYSLKSTVYCIGQRLNALLHQFQYSVILHLILHALWKPNFKIKTNSLPLGVSNYGQAYVHCGVRHLPKQSGKIIVRKGNEILRFQWGLFGQALVPFPALLVIPFT